MKAHMALIQPRSLFGSSYERRGGIQRGFSSALASMLELLTPEDAAKLIDRGFAANSLDNSYYTLLEELMEAGRTQILEQVPRLVLQYSSYLGVREMIERARKAKERYFYEPVLTALQMACERPKSNMLMLQLLVGRLHVDVNAQCALLDEHGYNPAEEVTSGGDRTSSSRIRGSLLAVGGYEVLACAWR